MTRKPRQNNQKIAIYDNEDVIKLLNAPKTRTDQVRLFCMVRFGTHPKNLRAWKPGENIILTETEGLIRYLRAKNSRPMRFIIPRGQAAVIRQVAARPKGLNISNQQYEQVCHEAQELSGVDYPGRISPLTLRHTFILNELKRNMQMHQAGRLPGDIIDLTAAAAGCTRETVMGHYLSLEQWAGMHGPGTYEPLDLTDFRFKETD